jgi:hypothetical protein
VNRNQAGLSEFRVAYCQDAVVEVDVLQIKAQCFSNPHPGDAQQAEDRIARPARDRLGAPASLQASCQKAGDLLLVEDAGLEAASLPRQQIRWWDLGTRVSHDVIARETANGAQPSSKVVRIGRFRSLRPGQSRLRAVSVERWVVVPASLRGSAVDQLYRGRTSERGDPQGRLRHPGRRRGRLPRARSAIAREVGTLTPGDQRIGVLIAASDGGDRLTSRRSIS